MGKDTIYNDGVNDGIEQGKEEGLINTIKKMLKKNYSIKEIQDIMECSTEYIEKIKKVYNNVEYPSIQEFIIILVIFYEFNVSHKPISKIQMV